MRLEATETYKCTSCGHTFKAPPGPVENEFNDGACPMCACLYVKWLTYEQNFGATRRGPTRN